MPIILLSPDSAEAYYYIERHIKNALTIKKIAKALNQTLLRPVTRTINLSLSHTLWWGSRELIGHVTLN